MDLETFNLPSISNGVPQSTLEIIDLDNYNLSGKRAISEFIDLSDEEDDDDDIKILDFIPKSTSFGKRKRNKKGESSSSRNVPFVCEICTNTKRMGDAFYIDGCPHVYCSDCVAMYIGSKLDDNITNIGCPVPRCNGLLEPEFCRSILKPEVFDRWGKALCEALIDVSEKFYCPFADCSALLINDGTEAVGNTKCPHCDRMFCAQCRVPWHSGMECSEFEKLNADERGKEYDLLVNLAKKKNWKRCPKCRIYVARNRGCDFMKCRCGSSFCYKCGSSYSSIGSGCGCPKINPIFPVQQYQQIPVFTRGGVSIGGTFPHGYLTNTAQHTYRQIPNIVSTVYPGGNVANGNLTNTAQTYRQISNMPTVYPSENIANGNLTNTAQTYQQIPNLVLTAFPGGNVANRNLTNTAQNYRQIPNIPTVYPGGNIANGNLTNTAQTYQQIPNLVPTVYPGGNVANGNLTNTAQTYRQIPNIPTVYPSINIANGNLINTAQTYQQIPNLIPTVYPGANIANGDRCPTNSAQRKEHILNGVGNPVRQQPKLPSIVATARILPHGYGTYSFRGTGSVSTPGTLTFMHPTITAQRPENIVKGVVYPTK